MPIYTYRCDECGVQFEQYQKFDDEPLSICPECGEPSLHKVYTPAGIIFKGSGFYATDHRSPSGQQAHSHKEADKGKSEGAASAASETSSSTDSGKKDKS